MDKYTPIVTAYGQIYANSDNMDKYTLIVRVKMNSKYEKVVF